MIIIITIIIQDIYTSLIIASGFISQHLSPNHRPWRQGRLQQLLMGAVLTMKFSFNCLI